MHEVFRVVWSSFCLVFPVGLLQELLVLLFWSGEGGRCSIVFSISKLLVACNSAFGCCVEESFIELLGDIYKSNATCYLSMTHTCINTYFEIVKVSVWVSRFLTPEKCVGLTQSTGR